MKLLALDTATEACSAALSIDGEIRSRFEIAPRDHSKLILPMMQSLLDEANIKVFDLDGMAFGRGPGSFTGVRIGASVLQGVAFAADLPVAAVSNLAALAQGAYRQRGTEKVCAAFDARMGEVYFGCYQLENGVMRLAGEEWVAKPEELPVLDSEGWFGAGTGFATYGEALTRQLQYVSEVNGDSLPDAKDIVELATGMFKAGQTVAADQAIPVYLRNNVAAKPKNPQVF